MTGARIDDRVARIDAAAQTVGLRVAGVAPLAAEDHARDPSLGGLRSVALLGPAPGRFWPVFSDSPEYADGAPDPIDRWSLRVGAALALRLDARALYPFGAPPYHPFYSWALRTGRIWPSPINLLVSVDVGLWTSFRLALAFPDSLEPAPERQPCDSCRNAPCRTACPVDAFAGGAYDVDRCRAHCASPAGVDCVQTGCRARRACPVGAGATPPPPQAALHMSAFLGVPNSRE